jgi:hypothetical protein
MDGWDGIGLELEWCPGHVGIMVMMRIGIFNGLDVFYYEFFCDDVNVMNRSTHLSLKCHQSIKD